MAEIVNATMDLYEAHYPAAPPGTAHVRFLVDDGTAVAAAGWHASPVGPLVFSDVFDTSVSKITLLRKAREFMETVPHGAVCYARPSSWALLDWLGWQPAGAGDPEGVWFRWLE